MNAGQAAQAAEALVPDAVIKRVMVSAVSGSLAKALIWSCQRSR